jgi:hypothetical protein
VLPEFFAFIAVDIFVALSLLTCLLDYYFPDKLPYIFQAAAIGGYVHILISKQFFLLADASVRFWFCLLYLIVALANLIALNVYLALNKKQWKLAKVFSGIVVFPTVMISCYFSYTYALNLIGFQVLQFALALLGISVLVSFSPRIIGKITGRR